MTLSTCTLSSGVTISDYPDDIQVPAYLLLLCSSLCLVGNTRKPSPLESSPQPKADDSWCTFHLTQTLTSTNLDSILKSRDITFPRKVHLVKAMVFPVVMYGCESWTIKKAERQRIDAFELWCWRRLLRVSWTARRSNQSILEEISPEYSLKGLMLKLKLRYFCHLMRRANSLVKI